MGIFFYLYDLTGEFSSQTFGKIVFGIKRAKVFGIPGLKNQLIDANQRPRFRLRFGQSQTRAEIWSANQRRTFISI